ncbi:MAG: ribosome maturation factor RimM [Hyphomicrobiaceae bacterium]
MTSKGEKVLLGRINGAHGLRGDLIVHAYTFDPADIAAYGPLQAADGTRSFDVTIVRVTDKGVIVRVAGVTDRTAAEALKGVELWLPREQLPEPDEDEFYHADLIGLAAVAPDGAEVGTVVAVQNYGAGDLVEVRLAGGRRTELIPFTRACVPRVEIKDRRIIVVMPETTGDEGTDENGEAPGPQTGDGKPD